MTDNVTVTEVSADLFTRGFVEAQLLAFAQAVYDWAHENDYCSQVEAGMGAGNRALAYGFPRLVEDRHDERIVQPEVDGTVEWDEKYEVTVHRTMPVSFPGPWSRDKALQAARDMDDQGAQEHEVIAAVREGGWEFVDGSERSWSAVQD